MKHLKKCKKRFSHPFFFWDIQYNLVAMHTTFQKKKYKLLFLPQITRLLSFTESAAKHFFPDKLKGFFPLIRNSSCITWFKNAAKIIGVEKLFKYFLPSRET